MKTVLYWQLFLSDNFFYLTFKFSTRVKLTTLDENNKEFNSFLGLMTVTPEVSQMLLMVLGSF